MSSSLNDPTELQQRVREIVLDRLVSLARSGVTAIPRGHAAAEPLMSVAAAASSSEIETPSRFEMKPIALERREPRPIEPMPAIVTKPSPPAESSESSMPKRPAFETGTLPKTIADRNAALDNLRCAIEKCKLCAEPARNRTQTVFGVGNVKPRVAFFGEAPGADEDRTGEPFVGRAGQLLTKIIEACTFKREDVYILNTLKCRPPDNRTPTEEETENCRPFFERQLEILRPEYVVCTGAVPMKAMLPGAKGIGQMRGKFHDVRGMKVLVTYHPAYLLRNPDAKKFVWEDMKFLLADMGIEIPRTRSES